jgi:DhnA family fructose-bisphosphate aldolase class Ia
VLAADHRARGVPTIEDHGALLDAVAAAMAHCDGILATAQPLGDLVEQKVVDPGRHLIYLSINRTGLAGASFELDDRLVASVDRAAEDGWTGVKLMTRIDLDSPHTPAALELLGQVLEDARRAGLDALVEAVRWRDGRMSNDVDDVVYASVIAHDLGAPLLKVPVPAADAGPRRVAAIARVIAAVGVPVLFLGGPFDGDVDARVAEVGDVMAAGGAGLAIGRTILQAPAPADIAGRLADVVHAGAAGG